MPSVDRHPPIFSAAFHPSDPTTALFASDYGQVYVYEGFFTEPKKLVPKPGDASRVDLRDPRLGHDESQEVNWADWSPDGKRIVSAGSDRKVLLWDYPGGQVWWADSGPGEGVGGGFCHDGSHWVGAWLGSSAHRNGQIYGTAVPRRAFENPSDTAVVARPQAVESARYSPRAGDNRVVIGFGNGAQVWDVPTGGYEPPPPKKLSEVTHGEDAVNWAGWSHDGALIVTASDDGSAKVWNSHDGTLQATLSDEGLMGAVVHAEFHPAGNDVVVTASSDGAIRLWSISDNGVLRRWEDREHPDEVHWLDDHTGAARPELWLNTARFSHDGSKIIAAYENGWTQTVDARV